MEKKVIFRDRQELQAQDLNNVQEFTDKTFQDIIRDAITREKQIVGLEINAKSSSEIELSPGRLYAEGKIYVLEQPQSISVFSYLPVKDKKWVAVSVYGEEVETDIQPRDFLIDLQTGQTEPRAVPMELRRDIKVQLTAGLESPEPQKPEPPTGFTLVGYIFLSPSGIEKIERATNRELPNLLFLRQKVDIIDSWKSQAEPRISTLQSDISALASRVNEFSKENINKRINELAADLARLKDIHNLPSAFSTYDKDDFGDDSKSDTQNPEYYARTEEGLSFPWEAETQKNITLANPYDPAVHPKYRDVGFLIPDFEEIPRLSVTEGYSGDISIAQYQYQTFTVKEGRTPVKVIRYGPTRWVPSWWLRTNYWRYYWCRWYYWWWYGVYCTNPPPGGYEVLERRGYWVKIRYYWEDSIEVPYQYLDTETHTIQGSQIAQTFLNSQNGWLTKIGLFFTSKDSNGVVYIALCETKNGLPDLSKTLAITSLPPDALKKFPEETIFEFQKPIFLEAGKRYALVITTGGNHKIATVKGTEYTQGTIFYSVDGDYFQGDFTKDIMFKLYYAKFKNPRVQIELSPIDLSGGIADILILHQSIVPEGTELVFEYQKDGKWYPISNETAENLLGRPALLPLRAVFVGSSDVMPAIDTGKSFVYARRPATRFKHISSERVLPAPTSRIDVQILLKDFDPSTHNIDVSLIDTGSTTPTPITASAVSRKDEEDGLRFTYTFNLATNTLQKYKIVIEGSTSTPLKVFHVAERIDIAY